MEDQIKHVLWCIDDAGHVVDTPRAINNLMTMEPEAKQFLIDLLSGKLKYEPEVWSKVWLA